MRVVTRSFEGLDESNDEGALRDEDAGHPGSDGDRLRGEGAFEIRFVSLPGVTMSRNLSLTQSTQRSGRS